MTQYRATSFDLHSELQEIIKSFTINTSLKTIIFNPSIPTSEYTCTQDLRHIRRILSNLLSNAFKYTNKGRVDVKIKSNRDDFSIIISDTGIGISETDYEKLFVPFSRIDNLQHNGLGLGLYNCQQLSNLCGGYVTFNSKFGLGSSFILTLPRFLQSNTKPKSNKIVNNKILINNNLEMNTFSKNKNLIKSSHSILNKLEIKKVLILDDDLEFAGTLSKLFSGKGISNNTSSSVSEALSIISKDRTTHLLIDLSIDSLNDNLQLLNEKVKNIAYLSGVSPEYTKDQGILHFRKPVDPLLLFKWVESTN